MTYHSSRWCELNWTPWAALDPAPGRTPEVPGLYRIRPGRRVPLAYIGQTGRSLRMRLRELGSALGPMMPFIDPHPAAPSLWAWRDAEGMGLEWSAHPTLSSSRTRRALECYLLWQYRLERGESTLCNHGRFHRRYLKSGSRRSGIRGCRMARSEPDNPAGGRSLPPLRPGGKAAGPGWMDLNWSDPWHLSAEPAGGVPPNPGLYRILDLDRGTLLYVGHSSRLGERVRVHRRRDWGCLRAGFSFAEQPGLLSHQLRELGNDLIGGFYSLTRSAPRFQFGRPGRT